MKAEYINPILEATQSVLQNMISLNPTRGDLTTSEEHFHPEKINASIGITGDLEGFVYFSIKEKTALEIVEEMAGTKVEEFNDLSRSAIGELANIIIGNTATNLSNIGYSCEITPPSIATGDNMEISNDIDKSLVVPLDTQAGKIEINVSLQEA